LCHRLSRVAKPISGESLYLLDEERLAELKPEVILLIPCGYSAKAAQREWEALPKPPGWERVPAAERGRVHALDANSYCSRPAPRVVEGVERIARLLHPEDGLLMS
jgi:iron complex transport system substrate-binding protein